MTSITEQEVDKIINKVLTDNKTEIDEYYVFYTE